MPILAITTYTLQIPVWRLKHPEVTYLATRTTARGAPLYLYAVPERAVQAVAEDLAEDDAVRSYAWPTEEKQERIAQ